jgi:2-dehydropantoate 2-reductase
MHEVINAARQLGFDIPFAVAEERIAKTRQMGAYKPSTLIDYERGQPLELESMFLEALRRAQTAGVPTPRLISLSAILQQLNP